MKSKKQIEKLVILLCILTLVLSNDGAEIHQTVQEFQAFQSSYSEIKEPCSCVEKPILFAEEELTEDVFSVLENVVYREMHMSGIMRQLLACLLTYLVFLAVLLKHFSSGMYQFSCSPTCGLARMLVFIQDADGRK